MTLMQPHAGQSKVIVHPGAYPAAMIRLSLHVFHPTLMSQYEYGYGV